MEAKVWWGFIIFFAGILGLFYVLKYVLIYLYR